MKIISYVYLLPLMSVDLYLMMLQKIRYYCGFYLMQDSDIGSENIARFLAVFALMIYSIIFAVLLVKRSHCTLNGLLVAVLIILLGANIGEPNSYNVIIFGLKDRLMKELQIDGLVAMATDVNSFPNPNGSVDYKVFMHEDMIILDKDLQKIRYFERWKCAIVR